MVVTTDHGRGQGAGWKGHGTQPIYAGCETSWCVLLCRTKAHMQHAKQHMPNMTYLADVYTLLSALCLC